MRTYNPIEIKEWTDNNNTAICPYCDIDAVLPDNKNFPITDPDFLAKMQEYWF
ncbi:MAG: hypothetical protein KDC07_04010 [Chitinophagaceae bacterium]|nr:hypothetical protein [Chitinophagaceae bacterium]